VIGSLGTAKVGIGSKNIANIQTKLMTADLDMMIFPNSADNKLIFLTVFFICQR
jgi:hypothetical protein